VTVKAVILDLDGTLLDAAGNPVVGIPDMLTELAHRDLRIAVASNQPGAARKLARAGVRPDLLLDRASVGSAKGTKDWVDKACAEFGIDRYELVWLGNGDLDMRSAVNTKVAYFNAGWSEPDYAYGINVFEPQLFAAIVGECFAKPVDWFVALDAVDAASRPLTIRAMTDSRGGGSPALEDRLRHFLKERLDFPLGPFMFGEAVTLHLLGSIYGAGLAQVIDTWTVYPGSRRASGANPSLAPFIANAARLFDTRYVDDLLVRHTDARDSGQTRVAGGQVGFSNQVNTVHLNPAQCKRIQGKRIVVVDDFETNGNSLECARNLLLQAGAVSVTCVSIGKYRMRGQGLARNVFAPSDGYAWDPYVPTTHVAANFRGGPAIVHLPSDDTAPIYFRDSMRRLAQL
jgi:hypothetical protein